MMKVNVSSAKLKGTVLYTVVSVLMVLIVFLMGTLALAATASNRAYSNYQKEQTEYTGRAILDSVVRAINEDTTSTGIKAQMINNIPNTGNSFDLQVQMDEEEYVVTITNNGPRTIYSPEKATWVTGNLYEVATTVSKTLANSTFAAYIMGDSVVTTSPSGGGGAFVSLGDTGGTEIATGGYVTGGTYIGIGIEMKDYTIGANGQSTIDSPFFANGNVTNVNKFYMHYRQPGDFFAIVGDFTIRNDAGIFPIYDGFAWTNTSYEEVPYLYVGGNLIVDHATTIGLFDDKGTASTTDDVLIPTNLYCGSINGLVDGNVASVQRDMHIYGDVYTFDPTATSRVGGGGGSTALYQWAASNLKKKDGSTALFGNWYSAGSLEFNVVRDGNFVQGDVRADKNITINGNNTMQVTGDVVSGQTLSINGNLSCYAVYADTLIVNGTLNCTHVFVNNLVGTGTLNATGNIRYANREVTKYATETRIWYTDLVTESGKVQYDWGEGESYVNYSALKHTKTYYNDNTFEEITEPLQANVASYDQNVITAAENTIADFMAHNSEAAAVVETHTAPVDALTVNGGSSVQVAATDVETKYGKTPYPEDFTNANITMNILDLPVLSDYTSYPTTPEELGANIYDAEAHEYEIPTYTSANAPQSADGDCYEITQSCILTGSFSKNVYINPPAATPITVVLKDTELDMDGGNGKVGIIVNDVSTVTLFMSGTVKLDAVGIITKDYVDLIYGEGNWDFGTREIFDNPASNMVADLTIAQNQTAGSKYFPNVIIYGEEGSVLDMYGAANSLVTALVRAPKMTFRQGLGTEAAESIIYKVNESSTEGIVFGKDAANSNNTNIGVIGQLVAEHIELTNNAKWGLVYVTDGGTVATCDCGCEECTTIAATCTCECETPGCICAGGGDVIPEMFVPLYYNYY